MHSMDLSGSTKELIDVFYVLQCQHLEYALILRMLKVLMLARKFSGYVVKVYQSKSHCFCNRYL